VNGAKLQKKMLFLNRIRWGHYAPEYPDIPKNLRNPKLSCNSLINGGVISFPGYRVKMLDRPSPSA
jgi:hypothetical protein